MESEAADIPQAVNETIEAEDGQLIKETTNIEFDKILKEERMDAEDTPYEPHEAIKSNFEVESVKNTNEGSAEAGEGENFFNLSSIAKVSVEAKPDAYEVIEKPDQTKQDAWKIHSLEYEKLDNRPVEIIVTKETSEEIQRSVEKLSSSLDKVANRGVIPVDSTVESADTTSEQKVEYSTHAPDTKEARVDTKKLKDTNIGETGAGKFGSGKDRKLADNFDVALEKGSQETITLREDTIDVTKDECQLQDQNNSESSFLKDAEDVVIQEGDKTATVQEVSEIVLESIPNLSAGEVENQSTNLEEVGDRSIQTATQKTEEISMKQVDEPQIKHDECLLNESGKLSSTEDPSWDTNHEGIGAGDLKKGDISEDERSSENYLPYEKPVESLHVAPEESRTSASCQNAKTINPSLEQIHVNPEEILSDETKDNTIDAANMKDVSTIDPNEEAGDSIPYCSTTDLNVTHPPEGSENDFPPIDAHHDPVTNSNISSKEEGDQINTLEDQDHSGALIEVREDESKETESQVNDYCQVTSKPHDTETQKMDKKQDTTIQSEATADETIKICEEKTELEVTHSSENIEKIILFNENRNQHVPVAPNLEEEVAESLEGDKNIIDILSQEMEDSYQVQDVYMDNSMKIINTDSGAKDNLTVSTDEKTETGVSCEKKNEIKEPDTEILERRLQSQDTDKQIMMETGEFKDNCTETLEENSAKEEDEERKEIVEAELSTREGLNVDNPTSVITENKVDENLNEDERNVIISEQEIKNAENEGTGENFKGTHFSEDSKAETLEHEEESSTNCIIQRSIQSEEQEMWSKDCLDSAKNLPSVSEISEGSRDDIIVTSELAVTEGTEDPNLEEVKLQDKLQLDENDLASKKLGMPTSKPEKKDAEGIDIKSEYDSISNLGENRDVNLFMTEGNEVQNETQAALSKCNDQVAAGGDVSQNTLELSLGESYNTSYEEQNFFPVSGNESKEDTSENIESSSIIPNSLSAEKTTENIDTAKDDVGQEDTARNSDNFLKETVDTQKPELESKTQHENRMEYLDINSMNSMIEKDLESVEPTKEPPSTSEPVIELQGNKSNHENTITAVVDDGIKATEEKNESIGEILISQRCLDGKVQKDDNGREHEHETDGKQQIDSIQGVEKDHESDNTIEQEEKVSQQDFESRQREASREKGIQLGADGPNDRAPNCNQIITDGSLSEEVQRENENADSGGKIKEQIEEEGCSEDVQMIAASNVEMHEEKVLHSSSIKNLGEILSDDGKKKISLNNAEVLSQEQEESSVTEVPEDEKLANTTSLASVATEENTDYKIVHEPSCFYDKTDTEDVHVIDNAITISSKENLVQVDPEESTDLPVPCGEKVETMQQDRITVLDEIEEQPRNASEAISKGKITLDIAEDLNQEQEESPVTKMPEDEKLANMTSLASGATEENSDYTIDHEPSSFHDKTDTEDVQVLDDSITISSKENLVQVDLKESPEHQVPYGERLESIQQDPITVLEEIEEKQPRNASDAISEEKGVNFEGAKRTTDNCKEVTDSSSFVELDEISPSNPPQESRKDTVQMGEDKGTEKQQDDLHTLAHTKYSPMEITQKDAIWFVASTDGSEDTGVMGKFVAATLPASDENMEEEAEFKESEFTDNSTSNKNIQQLQQEDTSEKFLTDVKNMKSVEGELEEANCLQEKIIVGETIESRKESTSIEIAKGSQPDILQICSMETSHAEEHSTKQKELTINREELHVEKTELIQDGEEKLQDDKEEEEEAGNPKMCTVDVVIHEEKGQDSSCIKNLAQTNLDDSKGKITRDISDNLNQDQAELSVTKMSVEEKLPNTISSASKAIEENSESNTFHEKTDTQDVQVLEDSITCPYKENTVQGDPKESKDQIPSEEKMELLQQDSPTVQEEIEERQTGNAFDTLPEAKGVNSEGEKGINGHCEEIVASSRFVAMDVISHSNPLPESSTETMQEGEEKETVNQREGIHILAQTIDSPMEITQKDAPLCIASSDDNQVMQELEVASLPALDKNVLDEANYEETTHVEDHSTKDKELTIHKEELHAEKTEPIEDKGAKMKEEKEEEVEAGKLKSSDFGSEALTLVEERDMHVTGSVSEAPDENLNFKVEGEANKFNDKADATPSTVMKKETSGGEISDNEKCTNSRDETPEIINTTSDDIEDQEVKSEGVAEDTASVPQSETVEAHHADTGSAVVKKSESNEVEFADVENKAGEAYKSNDQNVEELTYREFPTLTKNNAENSEKETDRDYRKGFETKYERAVIEDNLTCDQVKQKLQEKSLELLSKVQSCDNKLQSAENNDHGENEESIEHGDKKLKDEDSLNNSTKKDEVDNLVDSNLEILQPDKLEKVIGSETQVQSFEVIVRGGHMKSEKENLEAAKEEIRAGKIVAEENFEANESKKIDMPSDKIKDGDEAVEDSQLGSPTEATIAERCQEGEEKLEEDPKVKTEEAIKCANEKVSENFEEAYINENVRERIAFDDKAVEEPKESIDEILHVKEEGNVDTEREVKGSEVAFPEHGEDRTGANKDTGLQNRNINFPPMGDTAAGKPQDNENIKSEAAPTKLIYETIETCDDNKEIITREKEGTERKHEKLTISESLGAEERDERQDKNQHQFKIDKQLKYGVCISNRVQEKGEEQVMLSAGEGEVIVGETDTCSRQTEDENEKPDFSSHSNDTSEISHSDRVLGIAKDNENSTNIRMLEKIFNGTTKREISEATCPNESGEVITPAVSKRIQPMEHNSEAITVNAEMHESKAGTASSDVETMGVQYGEERKENDDYKEMTEASTSMECTISTSKIMQGSAEVMLLAVDDQETQDQLVKLQHLPHLPHIQASEMGKTEEVGPVDLQRASNITGDMQELDEKFIALSNKENLAEIDPNESTEQKDSSCGKEFDIIQQDHMPATLRQEIEKKLPKNSSEAVSDAKDAICEEEKVTVDNCNEFIENNDKVTPSNMLQGSSSEAAQGSKDKYTPTQHNELPILSDFKYSDMERTQTDVELCVERLNSIDVTKVAQNLDAVPVHASDKQIITDADLTKNVDAFNSTVEYKNVPQLQQATTEIFQAEGEIQKPSGVEQEEAKCGQEERTDETSESTNKSASTEIAEPSLSDLLQGSLKESSEMADHHAEGRKSAVQKEELKAGKTEEANHEEEKHGHEESNEQKKSDLGSEAPVMLDTGAVDAKVAHKKSHNILSGVGSKMKHSIAKVKKAITGKSSHPKPPLPKESEEC
ncbi:titin isoform X2 [Olea europaea var. sylvestris]|uniref:titin isoform X2 n=1 Tax=Olea europaea var. sylvestris TaxID=158386 RepID=UPI000C1D2BED|nr:titin isoform X2 [Olea europaea var. sylvestris]